MTKYQPNILAGSVYVHAGITMLINSGHPHAMELGHPAGYNEGKIHMLDDMYLIWLDNCEHGCQMCYVPRDKMQMISSDTNKGEWKFYG